MVRKCVIEGCDSKSSVPAHHGVTYHSFPFDSKTREKWIENCRIPINRNITKNVLVCSRHFRRVDFQPQKSGKYLLKQGASPTVFPWGKIDSPAITPTTNVTPAQSLINEIPNFGNVEGSIETGVTTTETTTTASVEATIAQIMAETAELNAIAGIKTTLLKDETIKEGIKMKRSSSDVTTEDRPLKIPRPSFDSSAADAVGSSSASAASISSPVMSPMLSQQPTLMPSRKIDASTIFTPGVKLEAQDFDGLWQAAKVVEVDNDDREVLIKFEKFSKNKSVAIGSEEWIPMNSTRLREKASLNAKQLPVFSLEEKCLARWTGSRKYSATVKKCLGNDLYEVLFYDGFVKVLKASHMSKIRGVVKSTPLSTEPTTPVTSPSTASNLNQETPIARKQTKSPKVNTPVASSTTKTKSRQGGQGKKDWPLISMASLDLEALDLPEIPKDGEWTCYWVNDQPIGKEGFLIVGDHKKPTVIVDDWRLPANWVKHMYQRSNVLGKWDVILVNPQGKRFRSKADLKQFIEDLGQVYNPDIYDFSIHRRRAKDIGAYKYTPDYNRTLSNPKVELTQSTVTENGPVVAANASSETLDSPSKDDQPSTIDSTIVSSLAATSSLYTETPVAPLVPPMELMTSPVPTKSTAKDGVASAGEGTPQSDGIPLAVVDDGFAYIGGLKVQIIDNLFRCPQEGCFKNFRKENHLQIHVKHYHQDLIKLLGACPNMQELASKRSLGNPESDIHPKNQIPNQQFFAKLHQQDLQQSRAHRRTLAANLTPLNTPEASTTQSPMHVVASEEEPSTIDTNLKSQKLENSIIETANLSSDLSHSLAVSDDGSVLGQAALLAGNKKTTDEKFKSETSASVISKKGRFSPMKRASGARKSNRQRTTKKYVTAPTTNTSPAAVVAATAAPIVASTATTSGYDASSAVYNASFGASEFEETRHSFNATPDAKPVSSKRSRGSYTQPQTPLTAPATPLSNVDSPLTGDGNHTNESSCFAPSESPKYIKENGELIKIVRMRQEEIINCLCSYGEEDGLMIQCELCLCWQHGICNGIDKESDVPDKYVCYICRNPQRGRESLKYIHDQDWLYDGKLAVGFYHEPNPMLLERFELLKKSHTLTGNLLDLKHFMHSLRVKINIGGNKDHPKMYLWEKRWEQDTPKKEEDAEQTIKEEIKSELVGGNTDIEKNINDVVTKTESDYQATTPTKKTKIELLPTPIVPQPEAPIDPVECQHRLLEHIKIQQNLAMNRLNDIEEQIDELESMDTLPDLKSASDSEIKDVLAAMIKDLETMKQIAKINALANTKHVTVNPIVIK